jgi:hypothetical protein
MKAANLFKTAIASGLMMTGVESQAQTTVIETIQEPGGDVEVFQHTYTDGFDRMGHITLLNAGADIQLRSNRKPYKKKEDKGYSLNISNKTLIPGSVTFTRADQIGGSQMVYYGGGLCPVEKKSIMLSSTKQGLQPERRNLKPAFFAYGALGLFNEPKRKENFRGWTHSTNFNAGLGLMVGDMQEESDVQPFAFGDANFVFGFKFGARNMNRPRDRRMTKTLGIGVSAVGMARLTSQEVTLGGDLPPEQQQTVLVTGTVMPFIAAQFCLQ